MCIPTFRTISSLINSPHPPLPYIPYLALFSFIFGWLLYSKVGELKRQVSSGQQLHGVDWVPCGHILAGRAVSG